MCVCVCMFTPHLPEDGEQEVAHTKARGPCGILARKVKTQDNKVALRFGDSF